MDPVLDALETRLGTSFRKQRLLRQALTHRSFAQHRDIEWDLDDNERLEFLGDSVLSLVVTNYLFRTYPNKSEGILTGYRSALVNTRSLSVRARELGLHDVLLHVSDSEDGHFREDRLGDTLEAIIGAIYLDRGIRASERFVRDHILIYADQIVAEHHTWNPKTKLHNESIKRLKLKPQYAVLKKEGSGAYKQVLVGVSLGKCLVARGRGARRSLAEEEAARNALAIKGWTVASP